MIDNLSYIYIAMYVLDLYHSLNNFLEIVLWGIPVGSAMMLLLTVMIADFNTSTFLRYWGDTKKYYITGLVMFLISLPINIIMPTENTIKAYMGVKAVQAVATYLEDKTDIPERSKATITKLWDRVDGYLTTIDIDKAVDKAVTSGAEKTIAVTGIADSTLTKIKEQVRDSIIQSLKK